MLKHYTKAIILTLLINLVLLLLLHSNGLFCFIGGGVGTYYLLKNSPKKLQSSKTSYMLINAIFNAVLITYIGLLIYLINMNFSPTIDWENLITQKYILSHLVKHKFFFSLVTFIASFISGLSGIWAIMHLGLGRTASEEEMMSRMSIEELETFMEPQNNTI